MTPELKLAATAAGLLLLLAGSIAWVVYDWASRRKKRKRYDRWVDAQPSILLNQIDVQLFRIRAARDRLHQLRLTLDAINADEYWIKRKEVLTTQLNKMRKERKAKYRPKDYYYYDRED